jgi:hypothetical protein
MIVVLGEIGGGCPSAPRCIQINLHHQRCNRFCPGAAPACPASYFPSILCPLRSWPGRALLPAGTDEYSLVDALKDGRITKPVVAWVRWALSTGRAQSVVRRRQQFFRAGSAGGQAGPAALTAQDALPGFERGQGGCQARHFWTPAATLEQPPPAARASPCASYHAFPKLARCCSGTCAKLFKSEVQFGHAGAKSGGDAESAQAKNAALAAAGAIVPGSFEELEGTIRCVQGGGGGGGPPPAAGWGPRPAAQTHGQPPAASWAPEAGAHLLLPALPSLSPSLSLFNPLSRSLSHAHTFHCFPTANTSLLQQGVPGAAGPGSGGPGSGIRAAHGADGPGSCQEGGQGAGSRTQHPAPPALQAP